MNRLLRSKNKRISCLSQKSHKVDLVRSFNQLKINRIWDPKFKVMLLIMMSPTFNQPFNTEILKLIGAIKTKNQMLRDKQ
jgi:hypothetical protein